MVQFENFKEFKNLDYNIVAKNNKGQAFKGLAIKGVVGDLKMSAIVKIA